MIIFNVSVPVVECFNVSPKDKYILNRRGSPDIPSRMKGNQTTHADKSLHVPVSVETVINTAAANDQVKL